MTDHDDVLKELNAALQVEPSRAFADGVRARVNRARTQARRMWWGIAAAASVGLATVALWRPAVEVPVSAPVTPAQVSAPIVASAQPERVVPNNAVMPIQARPVATVVRTTVARTAEARMTAASSEPRLEVITNQGALLRELWAGYGTRSIPEVAVEVAGPVEAAEAKPPAPIAVDPIVVPPIVVSELGSPGGRGGAAPGIRRVDAAGNMR